MVIGWRRVRHCFGRGMLESSCDGKTGELECNWLNLKVEISEEYERKCSLARQTDLRYLFWTSCAQLRGLIFLMIAALRRI